jgi:hypothetical protein
VNLSPRQQVAARFATLLESTVERVPHGKNKRFYRIRMAHPRKIEVRVEGLRYIVVNDTVFGSEADALSEIKRIRHV